eukprot:TRINITY_DN7867_c0_g3_i1.p3 TRINITY_DN7867_c0_g3~~TRINITY_DN7867_c0_g3_i1.p3  ORF type:complete len:205 (+),score=-20.93 TRINITY_DN7867_c0_g3_i1:263-877(+)
MCQKKSQPPNHVFTNKQDFKLQFQVDFTKIFLQYPLITICRIVDSKQNQNKRFNFYTKSFKSWSCKSALFKYRDRFYYCKKQISQHLNRSKTTNTLQVSRIKTQCFKELLGIAIRLQSWVESYGLSPYLQILVEYTQYYTGAQPVYCYKPSYYFSQFQIKPNKFKTLCTSWSYSRINKMFKQITVLIKSSYTQYAFLTSHICLF